MATLKLGTTTAITESSGALTIASSTLTTPTIASMANCTFPAGHVVNVQSVVFQGTQSLDTEAWTIVGTGQTGALTITTATPKSSSSKFYISCTIGMVGGSNSTAFRIYRGGSHVTALSGTPNSSRIGVAVRTVKNWNADVNHHPSTAFSYVDSPASASASVYSIQILNQDSLTTLINVHAGSDDNAESYTSRTSCSLTVMEIA